MQNFYPLCTLLHGAFIISYMFTDHKQIIFRDIKNSLTETTKELRELYFSHSRLVYCWIFYLLLIFALSLSILHYTISSVFQVLMLIALSVLLGRNIIGSLVAFGLLSAQQNVLEDIQYYMT